MRFLSITLLCLFLLASLSGCATMQLTEADPVDAVRKRATAMMEAKTNDKWDEVYEFYDSRYKARTSKEQFLKKRHSAGFITYSIGEVAVSPSGTEADVEVKVDLLVMGFILKDAPRTQHWIKEKGKWYLEVKEEHLFAPTHNQK